MVNKTARSLRKNETRAEQQLWKELRNLKAQGYHFRRQAPIDDLLSTSPASDTEWSLKWTAFNTTPSKAGTKTPHVMPNFGGPASLFFDSAMQMFHNIDGVMAEILAVLGVVAWQE